MPVKKEKPSTQQETATPSVNQIFDVAKPGTLPPADATTRPVIVTNRTIMHDPMMVKPISTKPDIAISDPSDPAVTSNDTSSVHGSKIVINPFYAQSQSDTSSPDKAVSGKISIEDSESTSPQEIPADNPKVSEPKPTTASSYGDDAPDSNDPEVARQDKVAAELEALAKTQDELDTLVVEKTYFLPINAVKLRRSRHFAIFSTLFIVLIALVWANIALDAGFITIPGVNPVTHLFSK